MRKKSWRKVRSKLKGRIKNRAGIKFRDLSVKQKKITVKYHLKSFNFRIFLLLNKRGSSDPDSTIEKSKIERVIKIPIIFCMIEEPVTTLKFIREISEEFVDITADTQIFIDHSENKLYGLSASFMLDEKLLEIQKLAHARGFKVNYYGTFLANDSTMEFMKEFGILHSLGVHLDGDKPPHQSDKRSIACKIKSTEQKYENDIETGIMDFVNYFNRCFRRYNATLSQRGLLQFNRMFGEILDNAQDHGIGENDIWAMLGYFDNEKQIINFAIMNSGKSIYDTLFQNKGHLGHILNYHYSAFSSQTFILEELGHNIDNQEHIWTLFALQDGVSRDKGEKGESRETRGQGMREIIELIEDLKDPESDDSLISIISGKARIVYDFTYPIVEYDFTSNSTIKGLTFNYSSDLNQLPDNSKVVLMTEKFNGTIITGRIKVKEDFFK